MDYFEVRQALAIIKDRVHEIKKDTDWKTKMAEEWNDGEQVLITMHRMVLRPEVLSHTTALKPQLPKKSLRS
jgi:hypothetical protein